MLDAHCAIWSRPDRTHLRLAEQTLPYGLCLMDSWPQLAILPSHVPTMPLPPAYPFPDRSPSTLSLRPPHVVIFSSALLAILHSHLFSHAHPGHSFLFYSTLRFLLVFLGAACLLILAIVSVTAPIDTPPFQLRVPTHTGWLDILPSAQPSYTLHSPSVSWHDCLSFGPLLSALILLNTFARFK